MGRRCPSTRGIARKAGTNPTLDALRRSGYPPGMPTVNRAKLMDGRPLAKRVRDGATAKVDRIRNATGVTPPWLRSSSATTPPQPPTCE